MKELLKSRGGGILSRKAVFTLAEAFLPYCTGRRKAAFTLAEVLITLGIIGVVAALMIPSLITNVNDRAYENQRKAAKSKITQAINMTYALGGFDTVSDVDSLITNMRPYFKIAQVCGKDDLESCFVPKIKPFSTSSSTSELMQAQEVSFLNNILSQPAYAKVSIGGLDKTEPNIDINNFMLVPYYRNGSYSTDDLRGILTADGTSMIVGYIPNCENYDHSTTSNANSQISDNTKHPILQVVSNNLFSNPAYAAMVVRHSNAESAPVFRDERACVLALIDVNGMKKPNTLGKDVFYYQAGGVGTMAEEMQTESSNN